MLVNRICLINSRNDTNSNKLFIGVK